MSTNRPEATDVPDERESDPPPPPPTTPSEELRRFLPRLVLVAALGLLVGQAGIISTDVGHLGATSRAERVYLDMQAVASGVRLAAADGRLEGRLRLRTGWIRGPGEMPRGEAFAGVDATTSLTSLVDRTGRRSPHVLLPDPWGNAYLARLADPASDGSRVKVLSAGPDGRLDTAPTDDEPRGDDLLIELD